MTRVGIRELRLNLSTYLSKVRAGAAFTVTDRGSPVAVLKPLAKEDDVWQRLIDSGALVPADGWWGDIEPPDGQVDHSRTASKCLQEMREDRI